MATTDHDLGKESGHLVQSRGAHDSRIVFFYYAIGALLLLLGCKLADEQLVQANAFRQSERLQTERRVLIPGPRGNIYDREGRLLVGNRPRFSVVLYLDELQEPFRAEAIRIRNNYRATGDKDLPNSRQIEKIARVSVVQGYLDQVNALLGRNVALDAGALVRHFEEQRLMPYTLVEDLSAEEFARLLNGLPVSSPLQIQTSTARTYPYGAAAAHVLGFVSTDDNIDAESFPGDDLRTFALKGSAGKAGLEKEFDATLQGQAGGAIYRVDPSGFRVNPPVEQLMPKPGRDLTTSLDIDLQLAAEQALGDTTGAAVALDARTGEVLVMASEPGYNLSDFSPHLSPATVADINKRGAWLNLAIDALYPPGSTFKTVVTIAGLRNGTLDPNDRSVDCIGVYTPPGTRHAFHCDNGFGHHGTLDLAEAIAQSCDTYFWEHSITIGYDAIAKEARRFHLDKPTGIELPGESSRMIIPDPEWKKRTFREPWTIGDLLNMAIGQGYVQVTPIVMACYAASLARGEVTTVPTLLHDPSRAEQHTEPIGLTPAQRAVLLEGMQGCTTVGTAKVLSLPDLAIPGVRIAGKTGTGQYGNKLDVAWFICFAPIENPEIAVAVAARSDVPNEGFQGGINGALVADAILKAYFKKHPPISPESPIAAPRGG